MYLWISGKWASVNEFLIFQFIVDCYSNRFGFVEKGQMSLDKMMRFFDTQEFTAGFMWKEIFKDAMKTCFQKSKRHRQ